MLWDYMYDLRLDTLKRLLIKIQSYLHICIKLFSFKTTNEAKTIISTCNLFLHLEND